MERLRVFVWGFWPAFDFAESLLGLALADRYRVELVDTVHDCDLAVESHFKTPGPRGHWLWRRLRPPPPGTEAVLRTRQVKRVFFSGEARNIPGGLYDGVISHDLWMGAGHFRLPLWVLYCRLFGESKSVTDQTEGGFTAEQLGATVPWGPRPRFACSVFGNPCHRRLAAARALSAFGEVDVYGRGLGKPVEDKMALIRDYRYNLCFENTIVPGYVTEKALQAKMAGCIPLWWGDPSYRLDFEEKSLVNVYEFEANFDRIMDEVDMREVAATPLVRGRVPDYRTGLADFFEGVLRCTSPRFGTIADLIPGPS